MAAVFAGEGRFAGDLASEFGISLHTYGYAGHLLIGAEPEPIMYLWCITSHAWQNDHASAIRWPTPYSGFKMSMSIARETRRLVTRYARRGMMCDTQVGHCKADETDVYAGRGPGGRDMNQTEPGMRGWLGNPHPLDDAESRMASIEAFRADFTAKLKTDTEFRDAVRDLAGKTLGCWCQRLDDDAPPCHAQVIAEHADRLAEEAADD